MKFEWDEKKNAANVRKHGVDFKDAVRIFSGRTIEWLDESADYDEDRWIAIGLAEDDEIVVVYVERQEDVIRLISARPATRPERERYWDNRPGQD